MPLTPTLVADGKLSKGKAGGLRKIEEVASAEGDLCGATAMGERRSGMYGDYRSDMVTHNGGYPQPYAYATSYTYNQAPSRLEPAYNYKTTKSKISKSWSLNDPEVKRRKRVASYKVYAVEGKMKGSLRKGFRWLKNKYTEIVYGWW